jgi:hypothetical protein
MLTSPGLVCVMNYTPHFADQPDYLGRILFDVNGFWIYDGDELIIDDQEQVAIFITNHKETI